jgi:uncharacterized LabA/DUF88 family protein/cold shock CspA family protein
MLKAGIFLDMENLSRCGGYALRYRAVRNLVKAQGAVVLRSNAYMAVDSQRESEDAEYQQRKEDYRERVRSEGFRLVTKEYRHYRDFEGREVAQLNTNLELAVDAMQQAANLDYVLLGSGDGDLSGLMSALTGRGLRVDLLSFSQTAPALRAAADLCFSGYLYPGILPSERDRQRGIMHAVNVEKGYGFLTVQTGFGAEEMRNDVFLHINDFRLTDNTHPENDDFADLKNRAVIEFNLITDEEGRAKAVNAFELQT